MKEREKKGHQANAKGPKLCENYYLVLLTATFLPMLDFVSSYGTGRHSLAKVRDKLARGAERVWVPMLQE